MGTKTDISRFVPVPYICQINQAMCPERVSDGSLFFNYNASAVKAAFGAYAVVYVPRAAVGADGNRGHFSRVVGTAFSRAGL